MGGLFAYDAHATNQPTAEMRRQTRELIMRAQERKNVTSNFLPAHFTSFCLPPSASRLNNEGQVIYDVYEELIFLHPSLESNTDSDLVLLVLFSTEYVVCMWHLQQSAFRTFPSSDLPLLTPPLHRHRRQCNPLPCVLSICASNSANTSPVLVKVDG